MRKHLQKKRILGDAFWALSGQCVSAIALLTGTRMLTELVTPEIYGQVALLSGIVAFGVSLFAYPFICAGMRMLPECKSRSERIETYKTVAGFTNRATMLAVAVLLLVGIIVRGWSPVELGLLVLTGLLLVATVKREMGIQLLIGERKQRGATLWQTSDSLLRPLLAITLVWFYGARIELILLGYILASAFSNLAWSYLKDLRPDRNEQNVTRNFKTDVWTYALPLIPMEMIFWVNGLGDRYVIGFFMSAADVGLYAAIYLIVNEAFNRSAMVLLRVFQPLYFQAHSNHENRYGFRILWIWIASILVLGITGVTLLLVLGEWVVSWLLAPSYHSALELMPAIAIGCALHALGTVLAQPLLVEKRTQRLLAGRLSGTITAAICIPLMVMNFGLLGAAMANPIYFGVEALVLAILAKPWRAIGSLVDQRSERAGRAKLNYGTTN